LLLTFIGVPLIEIALFIQVGGWLGLAATLLVVIATAVIGAALLRRQGLATLARARRNMARGVAPVAELFDGVFLLLAGALLLTPGFFTDALGAALLVPPLRHLLWLSLARRLFAAVKPVDDGAGDYIDAEFSEIMRGDDAAPPKPGKKTP
jgi:UPF0716 protein FxsA